jgi:hypothetical protein
MVLKRDVPKRPKIPKEILNPSNLSNQEDKLSINFFVIKSTK